MVAGPADKALAEPTLYSRPFLATNCSNSVRIKMTSFFLEKPSQRSIQPFSHTPAPVCTLQPPVHCQSAVRSHQLAQNSVPTP